jgi:hypothetical protein
MGPRATAAAHLVDLNKIHFLTHEILLSPLWPAIHAEVPTAAGSPEALFQAALTLANKL